MQVIVNSLMTSYDKKGTGPVVLLLHGWGDNRRTFDILANDLSKYLCVLTLDLPGFGGTQAPAEAWGLDEYAEFVSVFLKKVHDTELLAIIGHSNGGAIALRGLSNSKLKADKLILLAPSGIRNVHNGRRRILRVAAKAAKVATAPMPRSVQKKFKGKAYKLIGSDLFVAEKMQATFRKIVTDDTRHNATKINIPCLIIYGSEDTDTPPEYGEIYHQLIPQSRLEIINGAGHFLFHSHSKEIRNMIKGFLT